MALLISLLFSAAYVYRVRRSRARGLPPPPWWSFVFAALGTLIAFSGPVVRWLTAGRLDSSYAYVTALCGGIFLGAGVGISWAAEVLAARYREEHVVSPDGGWIAFTVWPFGEPEGLLLVSDDGI
jgi:hypothetical protein